MKRIIAILALILTLGTSTASASEVLDTDTGYGRAAVYAWSRGYHHIMLYGEYTGFAHVRLRVTCNNGYSHTHYWTDNGPVFRFVRTVPTYTRCSYAGVLTTGSGSRVFLGIGAY